HVPFVPRLAQLAEHVHWPPQPLAAVPEHNPAQAVACGVGLHVHELCVDVLQVKFDPIAAQSRWPLTVSQFTDVPQLLVTVPHLPLHVVVSGCGWQVHELCVVVLHTYPVPIAAQFRWPVTLSQFTAVPQLLLTVPHLPLHVVVSATG